jgi:hypothetical protein
MKGIVEDNPRSTGSEAMSDEVSTQAVAPAVPQDNVRCGPEHIGDEIVGVIDDLVEVGNALEAVGIVCNGLERARATLNALIPYTHHLPVPAVSADHLRAAESALAAKDALLTRARDALSGWVDERDRENRTGLLPSVTWVLLDEINAALKQETAANG